MKSINPPKRPSAFEELVGGGPRRTLGCDRSLEPGDLRLERGDALRELLDREQREVLPDLVDRLFLRELVVDDHADLAGDGAPRGCHLPRPRLHRGAAPAIRARLLRKALD